MTEFWLSLLLLTALIILQTQAYRARGQATTPSRHSSTASSRLELVYAWTQVDFLYPNEQARSFAIESGSFILRNVNPIGVAAAGSRVFITLPRWREGVPATLTTVPYPASSSSPLLAPYPSWAWNRQGNCEGLTSVYRVKADQCGRLWALDTGVAGGRNICPAQVVAFNLADDTLVHRYRFPESVLTRESLPGSLEVEYPSGVCGSPDTAVLYAADVTTFSLIVADLRSGRAWRVRDKTMYPSREAAAIVINGETLELMDGIVGLALSPPRAETSPERVLYYYPLSGFYQHWVPTTVLRNETSATRSPSAFRTSSQPRPSQAVGCSMDEHGVLFFGLLSYNALACWDSRKPFSPDNLGVLAQDDIGLQYPGTLTVDPAGRVWAMSARVHKFFLGTQHPRDVNFRVFMSPSSAAAVRGTVCEPDSRG